MNKTTAIACAFAFTATVVTAETTKTIFNPFTGKNDYITSLSGSNWPGTNASGCLGNNGSGSLSWVACSGSGTNPGGLDTYIQFNHPLGTFAGDADFTYTASTVSVDSIMVNQKHAGVLGDASGTINRNFDANLGYGYKDVVYFNFGGSPIDTGYSSGFLYGVPTGFFWNKFGTLPGTPDLLLGSSFKVNFPAGMQIPSTGGLSVTYSVTAGSVTASTATLTTLIASSGTVQNLYASTITVQGTGAGTAIFTEGSAPAAVAGGDVLYGDSTAHALKLSNNNTTAGIVMISTNTGNSGKCAQYSGDGTLIPAAAACGTGGGSSLAGNNWELMVNSVSQSSPTPTVNLVGTGIMSSVSGGTTTITFPASSGSPAGPDWSVQVSSVSNANFAGFANFTNNGSTVSLVGLATMTITNVSTQTASGVWFDYSGSSLTISSAAVPVNLTVKQITFGDGTIQVSSATGGGTGATANQTRDKLHMTFDGAGSPLTPGASYYVIATASGTIDSVFTTCITTSPTTTGFGSLSVTVSSSSAFGVEQIGTSICASACPSLTNTRYASDRSLSGWTTAVAKDSFYWFVPQSNTGCIYATVDVEFTRS